MTRCKACGTYLTSNMFACPECGLPRAIGTFKTIPTARSGSETSQTSVEESRREPESERRETEPERVRVRIRDVETGAVSDDDLVYSTPEERRVMSEGAFLSALILMMVPVLGLVFQINWGWRPAENVNKRNLARAFLVISVPLHIAAAAAALFLRFFAG